MSEEYKKEVLEHMSIHQLIDTILINPTVHISPSYRDTGLSASYTFKPLSNLVYTRDQQVLCLSVLPMKACVSVSGWACFRVLTINVEQALSVLSLGNPRDCRQEDASGTLRQRCCADHDMQGRGVRAPAQPAAPAGGRAHALLLPEAGCAASHLLLCQPAEAIPLRQARSQCAHLGYPVHHHYKVCLQYRH